MTSIETPEGWERSGPCFTRVYDGKFALLEHDPDDDDWYPTVHVAPGDSRDDTWLPLHEAVAWANDVLGVPKPVEVVEIECEDGVVMYSADKKRWALVFMSGTGWWVQSKRGSSAPYPSKEAACVYARAYVRGDA